MSQKMVDAPKTKSYEVAPGAPIEPGSILWNVATDWRSGLSGLSAGLLQLMHPHLSRGVEEHSAFFSEPWDRIYRSVPQIWATILDDDADIQGRRIRNIHQSIHGTHEDGTPYDALDPETFWWAHATFTWEMFQTVDRWNHRGLSTRRRERLYQETVTWYRRYGVSDHVVPPTYAEFRARFDGICRYELELTPTAERAIEMALTDRVERPGVVPALNIPMAVVTRLLALGGLPRVVRKRFDIPWSWTDELALRTVTMTIRNLGQVMPAQLTRSQYLASIERMAQMAKPRPAA